MLRQLMSLFNRLILRDFEWEGEARSTMLHQLMSLFSQRILRDFEWEGEARSTTLLLQPKCLTIAITIHMISLFLKRLFNNHSALEDRKEEEEPL